MDAIQFTRMLSDKYFFDLEKMGHKYSQEDVNEMVRLIRETTASELPLTDFHGNPVIFLPNAAQINLHAARMLLAVPVGGAFGRKAMEEEIYASLKIENINSSRSSIHEILGGRAPQDESETRIYGFKRGLDFIADTTHHITAENLHTLYKLAIEETLEPEDRLQPGSMYRHDAVFVVGDVVEHEGLPAARLPETMEDLLAFARAEDSINELHKATMLHFFFAYVHPYFDGNGRMARLMHLWYLVQRGYPSTLFIPISKYIEQSRSAYYGAYSLVEKNARRTGFMDLTPFLAYFASRVYNQLEPVAQDSHTLERFKEALAGGKITGKERALWQFVLSAYGGEEFSTKQLERDYGDAAYATIRGFVLKFKDLGLLESAVYSNRMKYWIAH